jgi:hypothetical protein
MEEGAADEGALAEARPADEVLSPDREPGLVGGVRSPDGEPVDGVPAVVAPALPGTVTEPVLAEAVD